MGIIDGIYLSGETEAGTEVFLVPAESEEVYTVYFRGKLCEGYEGKELKYDRSLPEIELNVKDIGR